MPTAIAAAAAFVFESGVGFAIADFVVSNALLLGGLAMSAFSASQQRKAQRKARESYNAQQVDRLVNVTSSVGPQELVLGRVRKGGNVYFKASTGSNKTTYVMLIALAAHEIDAVEGYYFNDVPVAVDGSGNVTTAPYYLGLVQSGVAYTGPGQTSVVLPYSPIAGTVSAFTGSITGIEGDIAPAGSSVAGATVTTSENATIHYQYIESVSNASVRLISGTDSQTADARVQALFPGIWTSAHRARGVAYIVCECTYNETSFPTGLPNVTAVLRGAKVYDPRENRFSYSQAFDNAAWSKSACAVTADSGVIAAPDGTFTAEKITSSGSAALTRDFTAVIPFVTFSVFVHVGTGAAHGSVFFLRDVTAATDVVGVALNYSSGALTYAIGSSGVTAIDAGGGWWRLIFTAIPVTSGHTMRVYIGFAGSPTSGQEFYAWGAQLEFSSRAKAYVPTLSASKSPGTVWTENPALLMRHVYVHPLFGKATPSDAEDDRFIVAAGACDRQQAYVVDGVTTTVSLYRAATVIPFGTAAKDAFDDLAQAMAGSWAFAGGELYVSAGVFTPSVMSLTDADLAVIVRKGAAEEMHPISISVHRERAQKFNVVNVQIWDAAQDYKQVSLTPLKATTLITRDGAELAQPISFPAIGYAPQALHVAGVMMRDARDPLTIALPFKLRAYPIELFDTVDLTLARYGWSAKLFKLLGREWTTEGLLQLTLKETAAAIYTPDAAFSPQGYAANTSLPSPWYVAPIGVLTITSGTAELAKQADGTIVSRMRVSWPSIDDSSITQGGAVEVQYRSVVSDGEWSSVRVDGNETQVVISDVQDSAYYTVRARARNKLAVGLWNTQVVHLVLGKTEPPPPFDVFTVMVQPDGTRQYNFSYASVAAQPVDWLGAEIRYVAGSVASPDWDTMTRLQDATTYYTNSPVELNAPLAGEFTFAAKSLDTTGNESVYVLRTITLPDRRLGNVFDEFFEHIEGWLGTKTGCHVQDGVLEANDTTTWATLPATWSAWTRWNYAPASPIYYETPVRDFGTSIAGQVNSTVDADGTVVQEMATSADGISWSAWGSAVPAFSTRYLKLRITVTATGPAPIPLVRSWSYQINAPIRSEYLNDVDLTTLTGSYRIGTGDIRIPLAGTYSVIKRIGVVIQDNSSGSWTWQRVDATLSPTPHLQFRLGGTLTDPDLVDFYIEGY